MRVVVLGGGLIGLSSAWALLREGHEVTVVETGRTGDGASRGNAGWVCPSQVGPLAAPGMLRHSVGLLLKPTSPLYIAPRPDPQLLRFLTGFARRCTKRAFASAVGTLAELASTVEDDWALLEADAPVVRTKDGVLCCFTSRQTAEHGHAGWSSGERPGPGPLLDAAAMHDEEPALGDQVVAGYLLPADSHVDPSALADALRAAVDKAGATVLEGAGACELVRRGDRVVGVRSTAHGELLADEVVLAAGTWTSSYLRDLGVRVPLVPGTGYSFTVRPAVVPRRPLHLEEAHVATTPIGGALRVAGTMELSGLRTTINERRVGAIARAADGYLRDVDWSSRTDVWGAPRPVTSDGLPLLGRPRGVRGCVVATGHGMYGVTLAPTTGRLVAAVVGGAEGPAELSPSR
jgi:D-amino-acid dehydrogenase